MGSLVLHAHRTSERDTFVEFIIDCNRTIDPARAAQLTGDALNEHNIGANIELGVYGCIAVLVSGSPTLLWEIQNQRSSIVNSLQRHGLYLQEIKQVGTRDIDLLMKKEENRQFRMDLFDLSTRMRSEGIPREYAQSTVTMHESTLPALRSEEQDTHTRVHQELIGEYKGHSTTQVPLESVGSHPSICPVNFLLCT